MKRQLWEVLVPVAWNTGFKIHVDYHREWDAKVRAISGGLTILRVVRGQWQTDDKLFNEKVIPCRVLCTRPEMDKIIDITMEHYHDQHAILAYRLTEEIILKERIKTEETV